ncbi:MAG: HAD-IA family hydrolase [DPANN group archaeon]|nr:HAD-IA family hydrolase [DPANN group archaeon]
MKAVILAAGEGKRMRPISDKIAKEMIPIFGRPFMHYQLERLRDAGISEAIIVLSPKKEYIKKELGDSVSGVKIKYAVQNEQLGTADSIFQCREYLSGEEFFLVQYGDSLAETNLVKDVLDAFNKNKTGISSFLAIRKTTDPSRSGIAKFDESGKITAIVEKPKPEEAPSNYAVLGTYIMSTKFFDVVKNEKFEYGREQFPPQYLLRAGHKAGSYVFDGLRVDLGTPADIENTKKLIARAETKAIIFDADKTLYSPNTSSAYDAQFTYLEKEFNIEKTLLLSAYKTKISTIILSGIRDLKQRSREFSIAETLKQFGIKTDNKIINTSIDIFWQNVLSQMNFSEQASALLEGLKKKYLLAVFSDEYKNNLHAKLSKLLGNWENYFKFALSCEDAGELKPSSNYYKKILDKLALEPKNIMIIGDSWRRDLELAKQIGFKTVLLTDVPEGNADFYINNIIQIKDLLE